MPNVALQRLMRPAGVKSVNPSDKERELGRLLILVFLAAPVFAAGTGGIQVTGRIPCAGYLAPAGADAGLLLEGSGSAVRVHAPPGRASFTLSLRTNCRYRLVAAPLSATRLQIVEGQVSAAAGGAHLTSAALQASITPAALGMAPVAFVAGPRVSNGGNNLTADNAILLQIVVESPGPEEAVASFALELIP
jgi:hypothetical protein